MSKFFSFKLYLQGLKKSRLQGITIAGVVTAITALIPLVSLLTPRHYNGGYVPSVSMISYGELSIPLLLLLFLTPILTLSMFSFLNKRNESDFYHSIPFTRPCVYFSFLAAIMTWVVITLVASIAFATVLWALVPYTAIPFSIPFVVFAVYFLATLLLTAFTVVAMTLTGTPLSNLLIFALLFCFVRIAGALFVVCMESMYPVVILELSFAKFLQFTYNMPIALVLSSLSLTTSNAFGNYGLWLYTAIVSIGLIAAGCWLYTRRRSEMAGQSAPNPILQHIYRILITLPMVFFTTTSIMLDGFNSSTLLVLVVITLLIYYVYEIITTKRLKNLLKATAFVPVLIVGGIVFALAVTISGKTALAYTPDADEIQSVSIYTKQSYNNNYEKLNTSTVAIDDPKVLEFISNELKEMKNAGNSSNMNVYYHPNQYVIGQVKYSHVSVKIVGKGGRVCGRTLVIPEEDAQLLTSMFIESKEYEDALVKLPTKSEITYVDLNNTYVESSIKRNQIWDSFVKEYNALSLEDKIEYKNLVMDGEWYGHSIAVRGITNSITFVSNYPIDVQLFPETARLYMEFANKSDKAELAKALESLSDEEFHLAQLNVESLTDDAYFSLDSQFQMDEIRASMTYLEGLDNSTVKGTQFVRITLWVEDEVEEYYNGGTKYYILSQEELYELYGELERVCAEAKEGLHLGPTDIFCHCAFVPS